MCARRDLVHIRSQAALCISRCSSGASAKAGTCGPPAGPIGYMSTSDSRTQPTSVGNKKIGYERRLRGHPEVRHRSEETVMAIYDESKFLYCRMPVNRRCVDSRVNASGPITLAPGTVGARRGRCGRHVHNVDLRYRAPGSGEPAPRRLLHARGHGSCRPAIGDPIGQ